MKVVETRYDDKRQRQRRVVIFQRTEGTFGFEEQHFSDHEFEQCWLPSGRYSLSFCDTLETALHEARARVDWLVPQKLSAEQA